MQQSCRESREEGCRGAPGTKDAPGLAGRGRLRCPLTRSAGSPRPQPPRRWGLGAVGFGCRSSGLADDSPRSPKGPGRRMLREAVSGSPSPLRHSQTRNPVHAPWKPIEQHFQQKSEHLPKGVPNKG